MIRKWIEIAAASLLLAIVILPFAATAVIAFSGTFTNTQSITVTDNTGVARLYLPITLSSINGTTLKTSALINLDGTNTAMVDNTTGADQLFMVQNGVNSGLIIPYLPPYGSVSVNFLMGASVNQTGFPIITGQGGYITTADSPNLESTVNMTYKSSVHIGNTSNYTRKIGAVSLNGDNSSVSANITLASGNLTLIQSLFDQSNIVIAGQRAGQHFVNMAPCTIYSASFGLSKLGLPVGTANVTIRKTDGTLLGILGTIDVSTLSAIPLYDFISVSGSVSNNITQDILVQVEVPDVGVTQPNGVWIARSTNSTAPGCSFIGGFDVVGSDAKLIISYTPTSSTVKIVATGLSVGLSELQLDNNDGYLTLTIDSVLKDSVFGVSIVNTVNDWVFMENVPFADNISYSVNGVQQLYYAPNAVISGTTLPDRSADATNNDGTITWGANSGVVVTYGSVLAAPVIQTLDASGIQTSSAYLAGKLVSLGSNTEVIVGFEWGLDTTYGSGTTPNIQETTATTFFSQITGLTPNTTYHFRAYLIAGTQTLYGVDKSFTTQPVAGSSTTILIRSAKVFQNYITSGDFLLVAEVVNNYTNLYPSETPREHFTLQLLGIDNITILGASPLTNWGDRPASIYFNPTAGAALTAGSSYFVKMVGDNSTGYASTEYALQTTDWKGSDLMALDSWNIGTATNMAISDGVAVTTYVAYPTNQQAVINDAAGGFFTTGIPAIGEVRPHSFATAQYQSTTVAGTASNTWDRPDAALDGWRAFVGASIAADVDKFALPLGVEGKDFMAGMIMVAMLGCVMFVVGSGGAMALGGAFISIPILWLGVFMRAVPIAAIILIIIFFSAFAIRQFVIKTL